MLLNKKVGSFKLSSNFHRIIISTVSFFNLMTILTVSFAQDVNIDHWETIIHAENEWRYHTAETNPGTDWMQLDIDDSSWSIGIGGIGYGDDDDNTVVEPTIAVFLRKQFYVFNKSKIERAVIHVDFDDAFIAYINGIEIARSNGLYGVNVQYNTPSDLLSEAKMYQGELPNVYEFNREMLLPGVNVLALEVHNISEESSDLTAIGFLSVGIIDTTDYYSETPDWFYVPEVFSSTNLPIFVINTFNQIIPDDPKIDAHLGIIYNGIGNINHINDPYNEYDGLIGIETRGESSQYFFPKKSYGFETRDANGDNNNVSLIGMPEENDWILYAPYSDKSLMRNVITYDLANTMGQYNTRTKFCELVLNGQYQGIYVLLEKIKRDKNRIDIAKLNPDENTGDDVTGGYILRVDKVDNVNIGADGWYSRPNPSYPNSMDIYFQYYTPKSDEITTSQKNYIQNFISDSEEALISENFTDPDIGYAKFFDSHSFANTFIINELTKDIDGYRFSMYLHKDKESNGGKLVSGPFWDFNLGYGNVDYGYEGAEYTNGWMYDFVVDDVWSRMFWWKRLMEDPNFQNITKTQWTNLRANSFSNENIEFKIDSLAEYLFEASERNYLRWDILGLYVWPNFYVGNTYNEEISFLKNWILDRADWMDTNLPGQLVSNRNLDKQNFTINVFPNPFKTQVKFSFQNFKEISSIKITDINGRLINTLTLTTNQNSISWNAKNSNDKTVDSGIYFYTILSGNSIMKTGRIIKI